VAVCGVVLVNHGSRGYRGSRHKCFLVVGVHDYDVPMVYGSIG
jgi:hypothetical protein